MNDEKPQDAEVPIGAASELTAGLAMIVVSVQPSAATGSGSGGGINSRVVLWSRENGLLEQEGHEQNGGIPAVHLLTKKGKPDMRRKEFATPEVTAKRVALAKRAGYAKLAKKAAKESQAEYARRLFSEAAHKAEIDALEAKLEIATDALEKFDQNTGERHMATEALNKIRSKP